MISVIDTSVLITFYQINAIHYLNSIFNEVYVPITVEEQFLKVDRNKRLDFLFRFYEGNKWFKKCQAYQKDIIDLLSTDKKIDEGEREAIAQYKMIQTELSIEEGKIICVLDEKYARSVAGKMDVKLNGTLYLLARLHFLKFLDYYTVVKSIARERRFAKKVINEAFQKVQLEVGTGDYSGIK